jgi:hypothetical protein
MRPSKILKIGLGLVIIPWVLMMIAGFAYGLLMGFHFLPHAATPQQQAINQLAWMWPCGMIVSGTFFIGSVLVIYAVVRMLINKLAAKSAAK